MSKKVEHKINWEQQGRFVRNHPNWVPEPYLLFNMDDRFGVAVILALMNELLDVIPPAVRGIACDWGEDGVLIHSYFDGEISEDHIDLMSSLEFHMELRFNDVPIEVKCIRLDEPENLNQHSLKEWVYRRRKLFYENGGDPTINPAT